MEILQHFLRNTSAECPVRRLHFTVDFGHFRGELLPERRTVKLQETLDFVLREVLIVDRYELRRSFVGINLRFVVVRECVDKLLPAAGTRHRGEKVFAKLVSPMSGEILHGVARANEFHQRADIGFFYRINGVRGLARTTMQRGLRRILRSALDSEKERFRHACDCKEETRVAKMAGVQ